MELREKLEVLAELGFRYSDYSSIGTTETYKLAGDWEPVEDIRLRARENGLDASWVAAGGVIAASVPRKSSAANGILRSPAVKMTGLP